MDFGASFHATGDRALLQGYVESHDHGKVYIGDAKACEILGIGRAKVDLGNGTSLTLSDVRFVPKLTKNLISVGQLDDDGYKTVFSHGSWKMTKGSMIIARGKKVGSLYFTRQDKDQALVCNQKMKARI